MTYITARVVYKELCKNIKSYIVVEFCSTRKRSSLRINQYVIVYSGLSNMPNPIDIQFNPILTQLI